MSEQQRKTEYQELVEKTAAADADVLVMSRELGYPEVDLYNATLRASRLHVQLEEAMTRVLGGHQPAKCGCGSTSLTPAYDGWELVDGEFMCPVEADKLRSTDVEQGQPSSQVLGDSAPTGPKSLFVMFKAEGDCEYTCALQVTSELLATLQVLQDIQERPLPTGVLRRYLIEERVSLLDNTDHEKIVEASSSSTWMYFDAACNGTVSLEPKVILIDERLVKAPTLPYWITRGSSNELYLSVDAVNVAAYDCYEAIMTWDIPLSLVREAWERT